MNHHQVISETMQDVTERKQIEESLRRRSAELDERVKELNCLHNLSRLAETSGDLLEPFLQGVVELLPPAWQYPDIACACITLEGQVFSTPNFKPSPWRQQRPIRVHGAQVGCVEVGYLEAVHADDPSPFLPAEDRLLDTIAERLGRAVERIQARQALRESTEKLQILLQELPIGVSVLDQNRKIVYANPSLEHILNLSKDDLLRGAYTSRRYIRPDGTPMPPDEFASVRAFQEQGPVRNVETGVITEDGQTIWTSVSAAPFPTIGQGTVIATVDITTIKQAEEQIRQAAHTQTRLLHEINHRVGNNLTLLLTMLSNDLNRAQSAETRAALLDLQGRIKSMSAVHRILQGTQWGPVEVAYLARQVVHGVLAGTSVRDHVQVWIDSPDESVQVGSKQAFKLALVLNELTTNCVKHAFGEQREGKIEVRVRTAGEAKAYLEFRDDGPGWPADVLSSQREGIGLNLIKTWIEYDLQGQVALRNDNGAVIECVLQIDMDS